METNLDRHLTPKQQKFCDEYLTDLNGTKAALRAGYSASTALSGALLRIPRIACYLEQRTQLAAQRAQISHEMVLDELGKIAFGNLKNYYREDGTVKSMPELTMDEAASLAFINVTEGTHGTVTRIKMNSKMAALEKIARHLRFYQAEAKEPEKVYVYLDKNELTAEDRFEDPSLVEKVAPREPDDDEYYYFEEANEFFEFDEETQRKVAKLKNACKKVQKAEWEEEERENQAAEEDENEEEDDDDENFEEEEEESESPEDGKSGSSSSGSNTSSGENEEFGSAKPVSEGAMSVAVGFDGDGQKGLVPARFENVVPEINSAIYRVVGAKDNMTVDSNFIRSFKRGNVRLEPGVVVEVYMQTLKGPVLKVTHSTVGRANISRDA